MPRLHLQCSCLRFASVQVGSVDLLSGLGIAREPIRQDSGVWLADTRPVDEPCTIIQAIKKRFVRVVAKALWAPFHILVAVIIYQYVECSRKTCVIVTG